MAMKQIQLIHGICLVDDEDYEAVIAAGRWHSYRCRRTVYVSRNITVNGKPTTQALHTFLTGYRMTDHINGDGLDNRRANLREANHSLNGANRRVGVNSSTGLKGVWLTESGRYTAAIKAGGKRRHLGRFDTADEAAAAYDAAARELFGDYARPTEGAA